MLTDSLTTPFILVVEDDDNHVSLIKRSFENALEAYHLEIVATLHDAQEAIQVLFPEIILTDYRLPDGDGAELIEFVDGSCPVIIMTSHGSEEVAVEAMKIGAQDYIVKSPETLAAMPRTVSTALKTWALILANQKADDAILRAKKDWERTFDAVPDLIAIIDINHTMIRVNKAMVDRCGLAMGELIGLKCCEVVHGLKNPPASCPAVGMLQDCQVHMAESDEKKLNGYFNVTVSPLVDEEGRVTTFVHVMRDITAHRLAEEKISASEIITLHEGGAIERRVFAGDNRGATGSLGAGAGTVEPVLKPSSGGIPPAA